ncbi:MAG TPA: MFS transporter [Anaeromyxobacteraceae bacterium]|nr:MFS transporter [Anaeromyxobacteraceae bacterium]
MPPTPTPQVLLRLRRLRWTAFALVGAGYVLSFFHRIAPAAIASELRQAFGASGAELGALAATYFSVYTVMQVPTGVLVDALGPRRIASLGALVAGAGSLAFGAAGSLGVASAGRALVGLGVSVTFIALLKLVVAWFREREFATLSGVVMFMGNVGAVLSAAPLAWAVTITSWRNVFLLIGLSSIVGAAVTWLLVRDRPEDAGLPSIRELEGMAPHAPHLGSWWEGLWAVARNPATWPGFFVNMGLAGSYLAFAGLWAVPFLSEAHRMTRAAATWHTTAMLVCFAFSSLVVGRLSDRMGRRRPLMLGMGLAYLLCWAPWLAGARPPMWASLLLFGAMGASATGFTLSWASVKEVNPPALSGTAMAVVNAGVFLGPTLYQPLVGWVLDRAATARGAGGRAGAAAYAPEDYRLGLLVLAAFALMGLLAALLVRETHGRNVAAEPRRGVG